MYAYFTEWNKYNNGLPKSLHGVEWNYSMERMQDMSNLLEIARQLAKHLYVEPSGDESTANVSVCEYLNMINRISDQAS